MKVNHIACIHQLIELISVGICRRLKKFYKNTKKNTDYPITTQKEPSTLTLLQLIAADRMDDQYDGNCMSMTSL